MRRIFDRITAMTLVMLMLLEFAIPAISSFAKEDNPPDRYIIQKLEKLTKDEYSKFSLNLATVIDDKNLSSDTNVKFALTAKEGTKNIKLITRNTFSLYDDKLYDTIEDAQKELDRINKFYNEQGLAIDVSIIQIQNKFKLNNNYVEKPEENRGAEYNVYNFNVLKDFDFEKSGLQTKLSESEKHDHLFMFDIKVEKATDDKLNMIELKKDDNEPIVAKENGEILGAVIDDKTYDTYVTQTLHDDVAASLDYKKQVAQAKKETDEKKKAEEEAKAKKQAEEKAKKQADEQKKKEAEEKAKKDADSKKQSEEQKALDDKNKAEADLKAKQQAEEIAKAQSKKEQEQKKLKEQQKIAEEKAQQEAKALAEKQAKEKAEQEAKAKAKEELKKKLGLVEDTQDQQPQQTQQDPAVQPQNKGQQEQQTKPELKVQPAPAPERKQKAEEFDKVLKDRKEAINKEDAKKTPEQKSKEDKKDKGIFNGIKKLLGLTDLQKADRELKAILKDGKYSLREVQEFLSGLDEKYKLSREDQAKLMDDNKDQIKELIAKDADQNFAPQMLFQTRGANGLNLEGKKFTISTIFLASVKEGPIGTHQYFDLILDKKLTVKDEKSLPNIEYNGRVIARPKYFPDENKIRYQIAEEIKQDLELPINVPVDYNTDNISLGADETFTVINKVKGLGVNNPPRDLLPQKVDKNGNPAGSIIEPGRHDVTQIIEPDNENYKVNMDATALPDIQNGELKGYNWKVMVASDTNLKSLDFKMNFTTVKGSGLGEIQTPSHNLSDNPIKGNLGINDSKHYDHEANTRNLTLTFYTKVVNKQEKYMLDISTIVKDKLGAKRVLAVEGYTKEKVIEETPTRVGLNNRTTIRGEFANNTSSKWTVTDAISTGDEKDDKGKKKDTKLPLETRILKNQTIKSSNMAIYQVDTNKASSTFGKMIKVSENNLGTSIPSQFTNPNTDQPVGTIAAYEYTAKLDDTKQKYSLGGVDISKAIDLAVRQDWSLELGAKIPEHTIKVVNAEGEHEEVLGQTTQPASDNDKENSRVFVIPNVKTWKIADDGRFTKFNTRVIQKLPDKVTQNVTIDNQTKSKIFRFFENYSWYLKTEHMHYLQNKGVEYVETKYGSFTLVKTDDKDRNKKLPDARFQLLGGPEVVTDENGEATFKNLAPGSYQLIETRAPDGYKLNDNNTTISVDIEGRVSAEGKYATIKGGAAPTATIKHPDYPGYMNAMHFGTVDAEGNFKTYIYLRALGSINGGTTNRDTRLNISVDSAITNVKVFDVEPSNRNEVQRRMNVQNIGNHSLNQVLNVASEHPIRGSNYDGQKAYTIGFPKDRFNGDWGFLVEVTGVSRDRKLKYDWVTDNMPDEAKLAGNTVNFFDKGAGSKTVVTVTNEKFKTKPVEIKKVDQNKNPLAGATFTIKAQNSTKILMTKQSNSKGEVNFGDLPEGKYVIEEIQGPENYQESQVVFDVTVDSKQQVSYKPRFKEGDGSPTNGVDYWIDNKIVEDTDKKAPVIHVNQSIELVENRDGAFGQRPGVWEAYRYESYKYKANIKVSDSTKGKRFEIQFDKNLDLTQYVNKIPHIKDSRGVEIADPYFDYDTNLLTYVFNGNSRNGDTDFNLEIEGIIPSKYSAKRDGIYNYVIQVAPGNSGNFDNNSNPVLNFAVNANYEDYDARDGGSPAQAYYFRDVYLKDGEWYVTAIAYYNPKKSPNKQPRTLYFNWATTNYKPDTMILRWPIEGDFPAFGLKDLKIYKCFPTADPDNPRITSNVANMPLSMGVRPERDPYTYERVFSSSINDKSYFSDGQNGIWVEYNPTQIKNQGRINDWTPLKINMPGISGANEGYVIEQTFKVNDLWKFRNRFRVFYMANNRGLSNPNRPSYQESAFASKVNSNSAVAQQTRKEIPKFYSQDVMMINKNYTPGKFNVLKLDESNQNKKLEGAEFALIDKFANKIYRKTDSNGVLTFDNLKPGKYRLEEVNAPTDYVKSNKKWQVNVVTDGTVTITETGINVEGTSIVGQNIFLNVSNKPKGKEFKIYKKDEDGGPLKGAKFLVSSYANGKETPFTTGQSNENGLVDFDKKLPKGIYTVIELEAPSGFKKSDKKWALVVNDDGVKIYQYLKGPEHNTNYQVNKSILADDDNWVDVGRRDPSTWALSDHRWTGYANKSKEPYKVGTRIIAVNKKDKYVIQRYVVNPEGKIVGASKVQIHREKPNDPNMDWYAGGAVQRRDYQIFKLDKPVTTAVEDIKLENYKLETITSSAKVAQKQGEASNRLELDLPKTDKPIVIDVKIPYKDENAGVGTGIDYFENFNEPGATNKASYWKPDFYTKVTRIVEGDKVKVGYEGGNILGPYLTEGALSLKNDRQRYDFKFKKVREKQAGETQTDAVSGATFKLTGPKPSDETKWAHSDAKGMVNFDKLLPGIYKLKEHSPAQGYEPADTDWTVTIKEDGRIFFKDNHPDKKIVKPEEQWQTVGASNKKNYRYYTSNGSQNKLETKITEVNKVTNKFRQVYILNKAPDNLVNPYFEIHAQEEKRGLNLKNTKILSVRLVGRQSTPDSLQYIGEDIDYDTKVYVKNNNQERIQIKPKNLAGNNKTIAVTIESDLPLQGTIGTGMDFYSYNDTNHYWVGEWYNTLSDMNLKPVKGLATSRSRSYEVNNGSDRSANGKSSKTLMARMVGFAKKNLPMPGENIFDISKPIKNLVVEAARIKERVAGQDRSVGENRASGNPQAIAPYRVDGQNANIDVSAGAVDTDKGTREVNVKITPKTINTGKKTSHWILLVDRSKDWSNKNNLDNNINKFLTDLRAKADTPGAEVYVSMIEYSATDNMNRLLVSKKNIKDFDNSARQYSYTMGTLSNFDLSSHQCDSNEQNVTVRDYLSAVGIDRRNNDTNDGAVKLENTVTANLGNLTNEPFDNKYVINFAAFKIDNAVRNGTGGEAYKKFRQFESMWAFNTKDYQRVYLHTDQETTEITGKTGAFINYVNSNADYKKVYLTARDRIRNKAYKQVRDFGSYAQKDVLDTLLSNNANFQGSGTKESLLKKGEFFMSLNQGVQLDGYTIKKNGNELESKTYPRENFIYKNDISLGLGESYEISYKVGLGQDEENFKDHIIHQAMTYKADKVPVNLDTNKMIIRRDKEKDYGVIANTIWEGGRVDPEKTRYKAGETVKLIVTPPNDDYEIEEISYINPETGNVVIVKNNQFTMPKGDVVLTAKFKKKNVVSGGKPIVIDDKIQHGRVTTDPTSQVPGKQVKVIATPDSGYELEKITVLDSNGREVPLTNNTFTMPARQAAVTATFRLKTNPQPTPNKHKISIKKGDGGNVVIEGGKTEAAKDEKVTFTLTPNPGHAVESISVGGLNGIVTLTDEGNGKKSFIMPDEDVSINATFKQTTPSYNVDVSKDIKNGTVSVDKPKPQAGDLVKVTVKPYPNYEIEQIKLNNTPIEVDDKGEYVFTMPKYDVNITASFTQRTGEDYDIHNGADSHTTLTLSRSKAKEGQKIKANISPDKGWQILNVRVAKADGTGDVKVDFNQSEAYFTMPASAVTIYTSSKPIGSDEKTISVTKADHGRVLISKLAARQNEPVYLTAKADGGYELKEFIVTDENGDKVMLSANMFRMPGSKVNVTAVFQKKDDTPDNPNDPGDEITNKTLEISNKQSGLELTIYKKDTLGRPLEGGEFLLRKVDSNYQNPDSNFFLTAVSNKDGKVTFRDQTGKIVKLKVGYYTIEETKPPVGYKKASSKWNVEVKTENGRMFATYYGPAQTTIDYLISDKTKLASNMNTNEDIRYASKIKDIDPNAKTFVQRIMIDLRGYKGTLPINVQIKPKHKREEFDIAGQHPHILKEGVKTAYRTTYRINDPDANLSADDVLNSYDLSRKNVTMINTARWRPFDWGFDEDQINLTPGGLYFMDVEGFYDDAIVDGTAQKEVTITHEKVKDKMVDKAHPVAPHEATEITADDLAKIQLDFELYEGSRQFEQAVYNKDTKKIEWKSFKKASYQAGAQAIAKTKEDGWAGKYDKQGKYQNWLGKDGGKITPPFVNQPAIKTIKTEADISSLYTTRRSIDKPIEIPKEGLDLTNEEESYNITFSKHGRDDPKLGINDLAVTNNRLEGAIFKLQRKIGSDYVDIPGSYVSSAFNGFFGFRGLKPGRYRLMEVQAPAGYKPINDAVLEMTIAYEKGKISEETGEITPGRGVITLEYDNAHSIVQYAGANSENTGKLVDYVTSATAKNMGKIINEKPEKGKLEITKTDEEGKSLSGAKFKLSRISKPAVNNGVDYSEVDKKRIYEGTVGDDGKLAFDKLPIGQYELEETSPAPGHKLTGQIWHFTVGGKNLDPYYDNNDRSGIDQSKNITLASTMTVERPEPGDTTSGNDSIHPNMNQSMNFANTFTIKDGATISPGDHFTVKVAENMDMMGIYKKDLIRSLDIFADGVGTIAKADYDDVKNTITYTFTDYARTYQLKKFESNIKAYIRANKIKNSTNVVAVGLAMNDASFKNINVIYDLDEKDVTDKEGNNLNMSSKITKFNPRTGQFTHYIYINRNSAKANGAEFIYKPGKDVKNLRMQIYKVDPNYKKDFVMPSSYDVPENIGMSEVANTFYNRIVNDENPAWTKFGDQKDGYQPLNSDSSYVVKLTGEIADKDNKTSYSPEAWLRRYNANGYIYMWVKTEDEVYSQINIIERKKDLQITAINPKNTIVFRKIDQQSRPLQGAEFGLEKQNGKAWEAVKVSDNKALTQKSGPDGLLRFENLPEGKYALVETKAPEGYTRIETHILEFDVSKSGIITRQVKRKASNKEQLVTEPVGKNPIEVINYKDIDFVKIDAEDGRKLEGAKFKLWYSEKDDVNYRELTDQEYSKEIKSDKDGKFKVHVTKEGYYALKETKAPNKYIIPKKFVREFRLKDGKIQILEKDPLKASLTIGKNDKMESRILSVDQNKKQFTQRIVLNYLHNEVPFDGNETYLRFFGNGWEIIPKLKVGGKIKVAVLDEGKKIDDLKSTDYKECDAHDRQSETNVVSKYLIKDLLGKGNYEIVDKAKGTIKTKKSIVIEYTGQILDKASQKGDGVNAEVKQDLYNDLTILDQLSYKLNLERIKSGKRVYVDKSDLRATEVENRKGEYPHTGALGIIGFLVCGAILMATSYYKYRKKRKRERALS